MIFYSTSNILYINTHKLYYVFLCPKVVHNFITFKVWMYISSYIKATHRIPTQFFLQHTFWLLKFSIPWCREAFFYRVFFKVWNHQSTLKYYPHTVQAWWNTENLLLVFELLDGTQTLESPIDHDGQSSAEGLTLLHTGGKQPSSIFIFTTAIYVYEQWIIIPQISVVKSSIWQSSHDLINPCWENS